MSDEKVVQFPGSDEQAIGTAPRNRNLPARAVSEGLMEKVDGLDQLLLLGVTHDGKLYAAATHVDVADNLLLVDRFKRKMMGQFGDDNFADF